MIDCGGDGHSDGDDTAGNAEDGDAMPIVVMVVIHMMTVMMAVYRYDDIAFGAECGGGQHDDLAELAVVLVVKR